jgi:hypothetical protein
MFGGLIFNERDEPAEIAYIGGIAHYVILDDGFRRHVEARGIDRQVLSFVREQMEPFRDVAVQEMMRMMGRDDLFTKAMIDSSLKNWEQALGQTLPEDVRAWLGMSGFRVVVNVHGEVVSIEMPGQGIDPEE